jgi:general secretion pathway protein A
MSRRLRIAGAPATGEIFSGPAIESVFRHSRGIPRLINTICENALLSGYAKQAATITPEIIDGVARDLRLGIVSLEPRNSGGARQSEDLEQKELLRAVKTLLEVRDRMQQAQAKGRLQ